jgi:hypothetical protein
MRQFEGDSIPYTEATGPLRIRQSATSARDPLQFGGAYQKGAAMRRPLKSADQACPAVRDIHSSQRRDAPRRAIRFSRRC